MEDSDITINYKNETFLNFMSQYFSESCHDEDILDFVYSNLVHKVFTPKKNGSFFSLLDVIKFIVSDNQNEIQNNLVKI